MKTRSVELDIDPYSKLALGTMILILSNYPGVDSIVTNGSNKLEIEVSGRNPRIRDERMEKVLLYLYYAGATSWKSKG